MFEQFFDALASILNFFYVLVPAGIRPWFGYGFSIMALTVLVMALITPLTVKSTRSMLQMQRMQPEMKRIQEKYKNDREKLNAELMAFYKENSINPLGGCLPMVAQMPVFIIMYQLINGLTIRDGGLGSGTGQILAQVQQKIETVPWIFSDQVFHPKHLNESTQLFQALSTSSKMNFLGMDLSLSASQALKLGLLLAIPYLALLGIMLATGLYQNHQLQSRNTSANVNPQQQMIMKFMPFFLPVFSFAFPAGMALYWCTQNFCRIGTNSYITRSVYRKEHEKHPIEASSTETKREKKNKAGAAETAALTSKAGSSRTGYSKTKTGPQKAKSSTTVSNKRVSSSKKAATVEPELKPPGSSVKSQAAHKKQSGQDSTDGITSSTSEKAKVNPRRSGESRRGSQTNTN